MFTFQNQVVLITGASSGLGRQAAFAFAKQGALLVCLARRKEKLEQLQNELKAQFPTVTVATFPCDITNETQVKETIEKVIQTFSKIDVLINNAGLATLGDVTVLTDQMWDAIFNVNIKGMAHVSKYVVPHMQKQHYGRIVNIASINGVLMDKTPALWRHAYNATKAAVIGLTKGMAASYGANGITVNAIGPGLFETEMTQNSLFKNEAFLHAYNQQVPLGRPGSPGELNGPLLFFASHESSYVTGQFLLVDGGLTIV